MNKIPTAEQFLKEMYEKLNIRWSDGELKSWRDEDVEILKAFANLHREAILKAAAEKAIIIFHEKGTNEFNRGPFRKSKQESIFIDKLSILSAYPKELIQ